MIHAAPNGASCPFHLPLPASILIVIWPVIFGLQVNQETSIPHFFLGMTFPNLDPAG
jgi:hypothetical protein